MRRQGVIAITAVTVPVLALFSLYTTGICACATAAQEVVMYKWAGLDAATLNMVLEKRFPKGMPESDLTEQLGAVRYQRWCKAIEAKRATSCLVPHERNFWQTQAVELTFNWDSARTLSAVALAPRVQYVWE